MRTRIQIGGAARGLCLLLGAFAGAALAADDTVAVGLGRYHTRASSGILGSAPPPLPPVYRTGEAAAQAAPTSQWYSSTMFWKWSAPLYAQPMTFRATEAGFEAGLPERQVAIEDGGRRREIRYLHAPALTVVPEAFHPTADRLARHSDWLAQVELGAAPGESLSATILHGSPYAFLECSKGDVRIHLAADARVRWTPGSAGHDPRVLAVTVRGRPYAVFGPTGATWDLAEGHDPVLRLPSAARYFSLAGLPDESDATLAMFQASAYAFPKTTRADWQYDEKTSRVRATYRIETEPREGTATTTLMGLYPHQWSAIAASTTDAPRYDSVRGQIRLIRGNEFTTERTYHGFVPTWGALEDPSAKAAVSSLLVGDVAKSDQLFTRMGHGTYWIGKGLGALSQLLDISEASGGRDRDALLAQLKSRQENWYDGKHANFFHHDTTLGVLFGYPQEYNSVTNINDHHFHYGYWLMAAAHVALRDPQWVAPDRWGGMVGELVKDIANPERGGADYPFLRNFDSYEGHSWASGTGEFDAGNNQESSSEAINAWAALVLLGEATGDTRLRDLGIYLYTTEVASVQEYWFDIDRRVLAPELASPFASMVFGGKYAYNTWWTEEPRQILGINLLPFTTASTYLGRDPEYIRRSLDALPAEVKAYQARGITDGTPADIWQDVLASYRALTDPDAALKQWDKHSYVEWGETRTHTLYWISSLKELGRPDLTITADTPLYAVFNRDGARTYLAYNARDNVRQVHFSDGKVIEVAPHALARVR